MAAHTPSSLPWLILTRPSDQCADWARDLAAYGIRTRQLPLIDIRIRQDADTLRHKQAAVSQLQHFSAIMHVSPNAVRGFWHPEAVDAWRALGPYAPRLWAPGAGTAEALQAAGFTPEAIDQPPADGAADSESLWQVVARQVATGAQVLVLRGGSQHGATTSSPARQGAGRDWLATHIQDAGARAVFLAVYDRLLPRWTAAQRQELLTWLAQRDVMLFSSSEAVRNLAALMPDTSWSAQRAIATHPRIGAAARTLGFGTVADSAPHARAIAKTLQWLGQAPA
ncbi:hypothetical protein AAV94_12835 [Lampropedia cohaerens]|uniref:Uroporphyrinogen-III synthase n=1 Tax=Lampropedia cohaerens TaxID=1610491 RepID=A0A0U1PWU7_9BURK|nr:uroporphyrinogen-III synthase [Lampropedia cohaerens]KKW66951.1 hypothetical protein AAV94_12835 [Lampropedia cohaerens]